MSEFVFLRPWWLLALVALAALSWWLRRTPRAAGPWARLVDPALLTVLLEDGGGGRSPWPGRLLAAGAVLAILALAGPAWQRLPTTLYQSQSALVLVVDLSRSMDAADLKPNRLERARYKLADLVRQRRDGLTALVVFAGDAHVAAPLSDDHATLLHMLDGLASDLMPRPGSQLRPALEKATALLEQSGLGRGDLLLVSDGDGLDPAALEVLDPDRHRLSVLGVGTPAGAPVPDRGGFLKDAEGRIVVPRLETALLRELAAEGGGLYQTLRPDTADVDRLTRFLDPLNPSARRTQDAGGDRWREEGPWLLLPLLPLAALAFRRGLLGLPLLLMLVPAAPAQALDWQALWRNADQLAHRQLQAGEPRAAAARFQDPRWRAHALAEAGDWQGAIDSLADLDGVEDWYNRGNLLAAQGQLGPALAAFERALQLDPAHRDAAHNRDRLRQILEQRREAPAESGAEAGADQAPREGERDQSPGDPQAGSDRPETAADPAPAPEKERDQPGDDSPRQGRRQAEGAAADPADQASGDARGESESGAATSRQQAFRDPDEQWLRRIPDNPGDLLRRKFRHWSQYGEPQRGERTW